MAKKATENELAVAAEREEGRNLLVRRNVGEMFELYENVDKFAQMWKIGTLLSQCTMVPTHYQGKDNISNCCIAYQMARELGIPPMTFMQHSYIVHGKPGIDAILVVALLNQFAPIVGFVDFEFVGGDDDSPTNDKYGCRAYCTHENGKKIVGPTVTWKMAKAEGWLQKNGSKWATIPTQMFRYRAVAFMARLYFADVIMGMQTREELEDSMTVEGSVVPAKTMGELTTELLNAPHDEDGEIHGVPAETAASESEDEPAGAESEPTEDATEATKAKPKRKRRTKAEIAADKEAKAKAKAEAPQPASMPTQADDAAATMPETTTEAPEDESASEATTEAPATISMTPEATGLPDDQVLFMRHMDNKLGGCANMDLCWKAYEKGRDYWGLELKKKFTPELEKALGLLLKRYQDKYPK